MFHFVSIGLCECMYGWSVYFHSLLIIRMLVIALEFHIFRGVQCLGLVLPYIPYVDSALHQLWNSGDILTKEGSVLVILVFTMQPVIRVMKPHVPHHAVPIKSIKSVYGIQSLEYYGELCRNPMA
jgi:hypothetical protein